MLSFSTLLVTVVAAITVRSAANTAGLRSTDTQAVVSLSSQFSESDTLNAPTAHWNQNGMHGRYYSDFPEDVPDAFADSGLTPKGSIYFPGWICTYTIHPAKNNTIASFHNIPVQADPPKAPAKKAEPPTPVKTKPVETPSKEDPVAKPKAAEPATIEPTPAAVKDPELEK
ncbi:hypothetical protein EDD18DRAFT_1101251 [Armillaria luteobubalina]|uniref:Uncharacterized protein n=1 Tax=Armillaria luteobubalina TaxID=153913 RepID=A0AA39QFI0_9AGAR|nr:hypothetical protein EDD18DRAFT_1101251 [Armillaria luteobubalina]